MRVDSARIVPLILLFAAAGLSMPASLPAQSGYFDDDSMYVDEGRLVERGDPAIAEKYLLWAEDAIGAGRWSQARAALERAVDFADVSSDISYLLALARSHENGSRRSVLQSLERAIGTGQWRHYTEAHARLMQADQLITLRRYSAALDTLAAYKTIAGETADAALLRLAALKGLVTSGTEPRPASITLPVQVEFRRRMLETLDRYPRDPRPLRILFDYARGREMDRDDIALVEIALRRLPFLLESDQELAWMAAPFIGDVAEARRLMAAYRAGSLRSRQSVDFRPHHASIVPALNLGLLDDTSAADELFAPDAHGDEMILDYDLILSVGALLRSEEGRDYFVRKLHSFTGAITENEDRDDYPESRAVYRQGSLQEYYYDSDQDGITDLFIVFNAGTPQRAELTAPPSQERGRAQTLILWERYPLVQKTVLGNETYLPAPGGFPFAPIIFEELCASNSFAGLLFPRHDPRGQGINRHMLASHAVSLQRPSPEFEGGVEQVFIERGIPVRAEVTLNDVIISVTEFENGYPVIQRLDMDLDGRMETVRRFDRSGMRLSESDWHGGAVFGSAELYRKDGSVVYSWDLDGDGTREYSETRY
jgi:hypothetical protein